MIDMLATPFVPEHLREHVHLLFQLIADWDDEILPEARDRQETPSGHPSTTSRHESPRTKMSSRDRH
ncbi:hypothetical protein [Janibacter limosus]|uniref:Uncharacterized protein n=1 Tax=Janibacter limosus TaxID=53458 RepID=A0A4P6MTX6_9MICO|nr:hypothetical protein [Janibacter limosus]QBF46252.1 hypothetical protein EXU32_08300 [Janibacter limosus]